VDALVKLDFTGCATGFTQCHSLDAATIDILREVSGPDKLLVVIDHVHGVNSAADTFLVRDHLNLTGTNPLIGPNHPCGERFTKVSDVYVTDLKTNLPSLVAAGLKPSVVPSLQEINVLKEIGADGWCYRLVPAVLVAAHTGFKVIGILLSKTGAAPQPNLEKILTVLNGQL